MSKEEILQRIKLKWKEYTFDDRIWITLTKLGYQKHSEIDLSNGTWQLFKKVKTPDLGTHANRKQKIMFFVAVWKPMSSNEKFPISGMCENIDDMISGLKLISSILSEDQYGLFRLRKKLNVQNAQDYGYIRGLLCGLILMFIDILPWHIGAFRPQGIMSTFLEYTRIVYYGTPGFAIVVGMAAIGIYFTVLFIILPIIAANLYLIKAKRIEYNLVSLLPDILAECEYGEEVEIFLDQQLKSQIDNIKREETYRRVVAIWKNMKREDFYELYEIFRGGLITAESLYDVLKRITHICPDFNLKEYLRMMIDTEKRDTEVILKVSDKQQDMNL
ncbi:MAG: hypothetical protein NC830_04370 [Candidatus Omnitrophica bacterium]|nr:hypothetical protein [Candidatus Omnitrophota bacterium]